MFVHKDFTGAPATAKDRPWNASSSRHYSQESQKCGRMTYGRSALLKEPANSIRPASFEGQS